jgi:hypothetical protein
VTPVITAAPKKNSSMKLPQLTLRDLFWLVLVAAILCGWWVGRQQPEPALIQVPPAEPGRYELVIGKDGLQIMVDTATGESWTYDGYSGKWVRRSPSVKK